ncbi:MAG: glutamine synthetase family protein [Candidatus Odinarchaeota archaeon]
MTDFSKLFEEKGIDYIQFQFTTILGEFKGVEFPARIWEEMREGTGIDGSSLGFLKTEQSDMKIIPDLNTFAIIPWNTSIGRFICDITDNNGIAYSTCPRGILKTQLSKAKSLGYEFLTRPELEWYFLTNDLKPADNGSYMDIPPTDKLHELRRQISDSMMEMGIGIKTIHHEVGTGQHEIEFLPFNALYQADNVQTAKMIVKTETFYDDLIATFMPKPLSFKAGSGLHIHQYLIKDNRNIFSDEEKGISDLLRYYIGGIQKRLDSISAILNPTTNSYKRLIPNHEAPIYDIWGIGNRAALIRVPGYEKSARIEYRAGDASMNIYLGTALLLAAGLDGIKNKIEPKDPINTNIDHLTTEEKVKLGVRELPSNLDQSLTAFQRSNFIEKVLGKELKKLFLNLKQKELKEFKKAKNDGDETSWELKKYLMC